MQGLQASAVAAVDILLRRSAFAAFVAPGCVLTQLPRQVYTSEAFFRPLVLHSGSVIAITGDFLHSETRTPYAMC